MQRVFKPLTNKDDLEDLFDLLPNWVNWITVDDRGQIKCFSEKPFLNKDDMWNNNTVECKEISLYGLAIDFDLINSKNGNSIIQRPINYQDWIGKWGVFADEKKNLTLEKGLVSVLDYINNTKIYSFISTYKKSFTYFRLLTQEEKQQIMEN